MKRIKKFIFLLCFILISNLFIFNVFAQDYATIVGTKTARVIEIIDGDAIKVQLNEDKKIALVKLIGVDAKGYNGGIAFLTNLILGADVIISPDPSINPNDGRWNYMYVTFKGININSMLVEKGYASVNNNHKSANYFSSLLSSESMAKNNSVGLWSNNIKSSRNDGYVSGGNYNTGENVNINTASSSYLVKHLDGITANIADEIVKYRDKNPFNKVEEIKFVKSFTNEMYMMNRNVMVVCTNIRTASEEEFKSISSLNSEDIDDIISYRNKNGFERVTELKTKNIIAQARYSKIENYISAGSKDEINYTIGSTIVNVNTASQSQLVSAGVPSADAAKIIDYRSNGYTYKTLMEIAKIPDIGIDQQDLNYLEDNLHVYTDINEAADAELRSLFTDTEAIKIKNKRTFRYISDIIAIVGQEPYDKVKNYIHSGSIEQSYLNVNTASREQLTSAGITAENATRLVGKTKSITNSKDIPFDVSENNAKLSLYTNINTASTDELKSLNAGISSSLVEEIKSYRDKYDGFGSIDEVRKFFTDKDVFSIYNEIKNYIVVR